MTIRNLLRCAPVVLGAMFFAATANAQILRAYLSSTGNDANPCNIAAPCRLLPAALTAVASGGEIWLLDSANYNTATVTIGKSVSILAVPGAVGSVVAFSGPAVSITASSLRIALRNMVIVGLPGLGGTNGVSMTGTSTVSIENSLLANLGSHAIQVIGTGTVRVANSTFRNNSGYSVWAQNGATVDITGTQMLGIGLAADPGVLAYCNTATTTLISVTDSLISNGSESATSQCSTAGGTTRIALARTTISNVEYGPIVLGGAAGSAVVSISGSTVTAAATPWYQSGAGGVIRTLGNNHFTDNGAPIGSMTSTSLQ